MGNIARALCSGPLADVNDPAVIAALQAKYPMAAPAVALAAVEPTLQVDNAVLFDSATALGTEARHRGRHNVVDI